MNAANKAKKAKEDGTELVVGSLVSLNSPVPHPSGLGAERFLNLAEVQRMLGISRSTLWRWTTERGLKVVRVGDVTRIRESDLQKFLSRHESQTPADGGEKEKSLPSQAA